MSKPTLQAALVANYNSLQGHLPHPLPLAHATRALAFADIVADGELRPTKCRVFNDQRLYLYYGGVYYRSSVEGTRDQLSLPIAFLFDPRELASLACCYPFDTGAVATERFGRVWKRRLSPLKRFKINAIWGVETPAVLVQELYADNEGYLAGILKRPLGKEKNPLPLLRNFLCTDLSAHGADQRQTTIECHYESCLHLTPSAGLLWVGFPNSLQHLFDSLCEKCYPSIPRLYSYTYRTPFRPSDIEAKLEEVAKAEVERYI